MSRAGRLTYAVLILFVACLASLTLASPASALALQAAPKSAPDVLGCKVAPTPEMPGRGMVGFFESKPSKLPPDQDPFANNPKTTIYEQYGYAGLRWNTYDLGCGPDLARSPDASVGTAVADWIFNLPKTAVAATGAVVGSAFSPGFLAVLNPLITRVVVALQHAVFEQWFVLVIGALGLLLIWKARQASLASSASAIGWAILVMVLVTMVFRWPLVAGQAADKTVSGTLATVSSQLNGNSATADGNAGTAATARMQEALLYKSWQGGTFGDTDSEVAKRWGPVIFDSQAFTWREAHVMETDPKAGQKIVEAKKAQFIDAAAQVAAADPDAYEYLTGRRSDSRVGYALLAGVASLCAVPFLFVAGLLVLGALIIVRFGVMLFPAFATLGLFPTMRTLVTGIGSTVMAALINAVIFGIGAAVTVLGLGVLLNPQLPAWLQIVLMLLLTIVMWVALSPFRRLTQMVSNRNHFAIAAEGVGAAGRGAARTSGRILSGAIGTFLGVSAAQRAADRQQEEPQGSGVPQRAEASTSYQPIMNDDIVTTQSMAKRTSPGVAEGHSAALASSSASRAVRIDSPSVTVVQGRDRSYDLGAEEIYTPASRYRAESRAESLAAGVNGNARNETARGGTGRFESGLADGEELEGSRLESDRSIGIGGARAGSTRLSGSRMSGNRTSRTDDPLQPAPRQDYALAIGPAAHERNVPAERREATSARDRLREELENQTDADLDELSEVFRPASSPERTRT